MRLLTYNVLAALVSAALLSSCAQGGRVAMGNKYLAVAGETVQILFQPPLWPTEQIGIVSSQGAQLASDATVYHELQSQAAKLGADAVLIISSGMKQYAAMPGFATYNAFGGETFMATRIFSTATPSITPRGSPWDRKALSIECPGSRPQASCLTVDSPLAKEHPSMSDTAVTQPLQISQHANAINPTTWPPGHVELPPLDEPVDNDYPDRL